MKEKVLVSVSGGRTSGLMAKMLWDRFRDIYDLIFVFANTSREKEETLIFVDNLTKYWGIPVVWVEAKVNHESGKGTDYSVTNFKEAKRNGEVFEEVIKKYSIPNVKFIHCTRELKAVPINKWANDNFLGEYKIAIGYRRDEPKRVNLILAQEKKQWYPLFEWNIVKADVAIFWKKQPFDLNLEDWEGNCKLCYKKSKRKLLTQIVSDPESSEWIKEMEVKYSKRDDGSVNMFFRNNESIYDLIEESKSPFKKAIDQSMKTEKQLYFDFELDEQESCAESCEPF